MEYQLRREEIAQGVHFSWINDPKFKHNRISVNLAVRLEEGKTANRAVVPYILRQGYRDCPDFTQLNKKLADLYGAALEAGVDKFADYQVLSLGIVGIDDRFALEGEPLTRELAQLLADVLLAPNLAEGAFPQQETALERSFLIDTIEAEINDKRTYAILRCKEEMCRGEGVAIKKYGTRQEAEGITPDSAAAAYWDLLRHAQIEVLFVGSGNPEAAREIFAQRFSHCFAHCLKPGERRPIRVLPSCARPQQGEVKVVEEPMEVKQGKLVLGFRVEGAQSYEQMNAQRLAVALLGGTPMSLLFRTVREKYSLCYYCAARYDRNTGLMLVDSGVERQNAAKAREEILRQIEEMKAGNFTDKDILETQMILKTALKATTDSLSAMESWYLTQILGQTRVSPNREIQLCQQVTRQDMIDAINRVKLDTVYTLVPAE